MAPACNPRTAMLAPHRRRSSWATRRPAELSGSVAPSCVAVARAGSRSRTEVGTGARRCVEARPASRRPVRRGELCAPVRPGAPQGAGGWEDRALLSRQPPSRAGDARCACGSDGRAGRTDCAAAPLARRPARSARDRTRCTPAALIRSWTTGRRSADAVLARAWIARACQTHAALTYAALTCRVA